EFANWRFTASIASAAQALAPTVSICCSAIFTDAVVLSSAETALWLSAWPSWSALTRLSTTPAFIRIGASHLCSHPPVSVLTGCVRCGCDITSLSSGPSVCKVGFSSWESLGRFDVAKVSRSLSCLSKLRMSAAMGSSICKILVRVQYACPEQAALKLAEVYDDTAC
ncbi:hypothetical protein FOZ62_019599, partial [Perkinsus olseni]